MYERIYYLFTDPKEPSNQTKTSNSNIVLSNRLQGKKGIGKTDETKNSLVSHRSITFSKAATTTTTNQRMNNSVRIK